MMGLASIGSVTAVLIILGFVLIIVLNVNNVALVTKETFDEVAVYLKDDGYVERRKSLWDAPVTPKKSCSMSRSS